MNMVISNTPTVLDCIFVTVQMVKLLHLQADRKGEAVSERPDEAILFYNQISHWVISAPYRLNKTGLRYVTISI